MLDKLSRTNFTYFLTGHFSVVVVIFSPIRNAFFNYISSGNIKVDTYIIILLMVGSCYILGNLVHEIDQYLMWLGNQSSKLIRRRRRSLKKWKIFFLFNLVYRVGMGHRISYLLAKMDVPPSIFYDKCHSLIHRGKYEQAETYKHQHLLCEGFFCSSLLWTFYFSFAEETGIVLLSAIVTAVLWSRSRIMAKCYVSTVQGLYVQLEPLSPI